MKGRCVICGSVGKLTSDHVPPKGVSSPHPLVVTRLAALFEKFPRERPRKGFWAPSYPTTCFSCNTERMGQEYDPVLIAFANELASTLAITAKAPLTAPPSVRISTRPALLARAVIGHLLAAEERSSPTAPLTAGTLPEAMRAFFLDPAAVWPSGFQLSCWPYLGKESIVIRGFGISAVIHPSYEPITGDLLKFYPLAFLLADASPANAGYKVCKLPLDSPGLHDLTQQVDIPLQGKPPLRWPEAPHSREIMLLSMDRTSVARAAPRPNDA